MYCQHLKQYFTYLGERKKQFTDVTIDDLAGFVAWLQNPYIYKKVVPLLHKSARKPHTVNKAVDVVVTFYDYLTRNGEYEGKLKEALVKFIRNPGRNYKGFLHGIAETKAVKSFCLKLRLPHMELRTIKREDAAELLDKHAAT